MVSSGHVKRDRKALGGGGASILSLERGTEWRVWRNNTLGTQRMSCETQDVCSNFGNALNFLVPTPYLHISSRRTLVDFID